MNNMTVVSADELFEYAEDRFGLSWNECVETFYRGEDCLLTYRSYNAYGDFHMMEYTSFDRNVKLNDIADDTVKTLKHRNDEAAIIIGKFMQEHNLDKFLILS